MNTLQGKTAVVTGGSGTLGSVMSQELSKVGANVVILGRAEDPGEALAEQINEAGGSALAISTDVLDHNSLSNALENVMQTYGRVDILVNAAGGNKSEATAVPGTRTFFDLPPDAMQWVFNLNFTGTVLASQVFGKVMTEQQQGTIINISSMASFRPMTRVVAYAGAKAAINNFTHWLAVYMATQHSPNIRVNAIAPGFFLAQQNRFLLIDEETGDLTERGQQIIDHTPMNRFGDPEDLIGALIWLAGDASKFVTGIVVPVDGGFSAFSGV